MPMPSIQRRWRVMRSLYWSQVQEGASPASSASLCRSASGTGAKKPRKSGYVMMWRWQQTRRLLPRIWA
eukprot:1685397-Alexandrium_andersonii.AAC.1